MRWLIQLDNIYKNNHEYSEVRVKLARDREEIRKLLLYELLYDSVICLEECSDEDKKYFENKDNVFKNLDMDFLKKLTNYLYFFELILAVSQSLRCSSSHQKSYQLINHFGWFMRSLCLAWSNGTEVQKVKAVSLFIKYLVYNRYQRLTEKSLCFLEEYCLTLKNEDSKLTCMNLFDENFKTCQKIFSSQYHINSFPQNKKSLHKRWKSLVGNVGLIKH